ncbi:MAG: ATP-binding cassette domain-containing protein, partial [Acidobacteriota bacterium]
ELTLGMLLAVQYIIGQLNSPLSQLIWFAQATQDAKISLERLSEVHDRENEESQDQKIDALPSSRSLRFEGVSFGYSGPLAPKVLTDLDLDIPEGKVTAIVGVSGSGKTTLLKLLLKFYEPDEGKILVGNAHLRSLSNRSWRGSCGVVMQDGHLFSDTIGRNIAVGEDRIDFARLVRSVEIANIQEFIESLPISYNTKIGSEGIGMSTGQKQRILIARAIYRDPEYLFFDEATSSLDANNEREIMESLESFYRGRTVVVIAHRLSTVKNADQIVVLDKGQIVERGNHEELTAQRGNYYQLVKNQLELGL